MRFDAIVIGGGIVGVSVLFHLSEIGYKVLLLEKETIASGSTGRCIGGIRVQFTDDTKIRVMVENIKFFRDFEKKFGYEIDWFSGGYLVLAHDDIALKRLKESKSLISNYKVDGKSIEIKELSPEECQDIVPGLNIEGLRGANYCEIDGQANPFKVVSALLQLAMNNGAIVKKRSAVKEILRENHKCKGVKVIERGEAIKYESEIVVNACGPNASEVAKMAGVEIPSNIFWVERHEALVTEPIGRLFNPLVIDQREVKPFSSNAYFIQSKETGQILGGFTPLKGYPNFLTDLTTSSKEFLIEMCERMTDLIPKLRGLRVRRQWAGLYPMTYTGCPIIDRTEIEGFYLSIGYCGHGFMLAPFCGKLMAEMIEYGKASIDISAWSLKNACYRYEHSLGFLEKIH